MDEPCINAWIGLGANLGQPKIQILKAIECLKGLEYINVERASSLYQTEPIGRQSQPDFINAVVCVTTKLQPLELLHQLLELESQFGRVRDGSKDEPRHLDLDLLIYGQIVMRSPELTLPHPRMRNRLFVLEPLMELEGDFEIPQSGFISSYIEKCRCQSVVRLPVE